MWLLVGLGNPGDKYEGNRHNAGFMAIDRIAGAYDVPVFRAKFQGLLAEGRVGLSKTVLLKPQTFMNNSGQSVSAAAKFYKIPPEKIVVFHDELDLPCGKIRVKKGGGHGGHNGLRSIDSHLSSKDYWRVRMGVGHPGDKDRVHGHVLSDFSKTERFGYEVVLDALAARLPLLLAGKDSDYMSKVAMDAPLIETKTGQ